MRTSSFWGRWVLANAGSELAGLGTAALVAWAFITSQDAPQTLLQHILFAFAMIATGAFEGAVVGAAQAWVLRLRLPELPWWSWVRATILGALVAWILGMLPNTIMAAGIEPAGQRPAEPAAAVQYGLAALLGLIGGPILALFQWRELRRHLAGAGGWMAANAAAWGPGHAPRLLRGGRHRGWSLPHDPGSDRHRSPCSGGRGGRRSPRPLAGLAAAERRRSSMAAFVPPGLDLTSTQKSTAGFSSLGLRQPPSARGLVPSVSRILPGEPSSEARPMAGA